MEKQFHNFFFNESASKVWNEIKFLPPSRGDFLNRSEASKKFSREEKNQKVKSVEGWVDDGNNDDDNNDDGNNDDDNGDCPPDDNETLSDRSTFDSRNSRNL